MLGRLVTRAVCLALGHRPSWWLAVAYTPNKRPPSRPLCERCVRPVDG